MGGGKGRTTRSSGLTRSLGSLPLSPAGYLKFLSHTIIDDYQSLTCEEESIGSQTTVHQPLYNQGRIVESKQLATCSGQFELIISKSKLHQTFHVVLVGEMPYRNSGTTDASQIHESRLFSSTKSFPHQRDSLIPQMGFLHCFPQKLQHTRARGDRDADVWRDASFSWILRQL